MMTQPRSGQAKLKPGFGSLALESTKAGVWLDACPGDGFRNLGHPSGVVGSSQAKFLLLGVMNFAGLCRA